jgi:hypothetical protein
MGPCSLGLVHVPYYGFVQLALVVTQKCSFSKILEVVCSYLYQNLPRITNPVSDLTGNQYFDVIFRSCDSTNHHTGFFFNLYGRFCPSTHHTNPREKFVPSLFLEDENIFQKSARVVLVGIEVELESRETIFEKCSHLREKGGVLMLLKTTLHLLANVQYSLYTKHWCVQMCTRTHCCTTCACVRTHTHRSGPPDG